MKSEILYLFFVLAFLCSCNKELSTTGVIPEKPGSLSNFSSPDVIDGIIRIKLDRKTADSLNIIPTKGGVSTNLTTFDEICSRYEVVSMERIFPPDEMEERTRQSGLDLWYTISFNAKGQNQQSLAAEFSRLEGITQVEPVRRIKRIDRPALIPLTDTSFVQRANQNNTYPFNDPYLPEQWNFYNDGSINSLAIAGADMNIFPCWAETAGKPEVIVAVIDEGVQYTHPDLAANMWEGIGYNFYDYNNKITWGEGHGTHVAGVIAAVNNNNTGICGIAGGSGKNDGAKIMTCQIFSSKGKSAGSNACAKAIKYAADNGAVICQNSWGYEAGGFTSEAQWIRSDGLIKEAIDYFIANAGMSADGKTQTGPMAGGVVIFAAGNEEQNAPAYPAAYTPCISVSAISCNYEAAWYTNYGTSVDICATGGGAWTSYNSPINIPYEKGYILSTIPTNLNNGDPIPGDEKYAVNYVKTSGYGYMQGTSMACPHISGIAALIISRFGKKGFTNDQLKDILLTTSRSIDSYQPPAYKNALGKLADAGEAFNYYSSEVSLPQIIAEKDQSNRIRLLDYERGSLTYTLKNYTNFELTDPSGKIVPIVNGDKVTLAIPANEYSPDTYTATLTVYNRSKASNLTIYYTIEENVSPRQIQPFTDMNFSNTGVTQTLRLSDYFKDYNDNIKEYKVSATPADLFEVRCEGDLLTLSSLRAGSGNVALTVSDKGGLFETSAFKAFVNRNYLQSDFYPNPCTDVLYIKPGLVDGEPLSGNAKVEIMNASGQPIVNQSVEFSAEDIIKTNVSALLPGKYLAKVTFSVKGHAMSSTQTILKY